MPKNGRNTKACVRSAGLLLILSLLAGGCVGSGISAARENFYLGRFSAAEDCMREDKVKEKDKVLFYMDRGMIRLNLGKYRESSLDFIKASDLIEQFWTVSASKTIGSLIINDMIQDFAGYPFERSLMHAFHAKNYLAQGDWDDAAVESRLIVKTLNNENRGDYPEDAYSRYVAGLCYELMNSKDDAAIEYRKAVKLLGGNPVLDETGHFKGDDVSGKGENSKTELVCLISAGRAMSRQWAENGYRSYLPAVYGEIYANGKYLGRSHILSDTDELSIESAKVEAVRRALKTTARVVAKEVVSYQVDRQNQWLGLMVRIFLFAMEQPDDRKWQTLPRWLSVARVQCPEKLDKYDVVLKNEHGSTVKTVTVNKPLMRRGNLYVSFLRDIDQTDKK